MIDQADFALGLRLHDSDQVSVSHGRERMILHAAFIQQHSACKQVAFEHGATVVWKCRRGNGELAIQGVHQRFGDRANVALWRTVKRRAIFEINLFSALIFEPLQGL